MTRCKICDVRDYPTAKLCAELGADYVGIHGARGIKPERRKALSEIATRIPLEHPLVGVVLVTLVTDDEHVCSMLRELSPTHLQLHSHVWTGAAIKRLREKIGAADIPMPKIVALANIASSEPLIERISEVSDSADILLLDITDYSDGERRQCKPEDYHDAVAHSAKVGIPALIAGGLDPDNIPKYLTALRPWGVDVQRGLEVPTGEGNKDMEKLRAFMHYVREFSAAQPGSKESK